MSVRAAVARRSSQAGIGLIEVLAAMVVLAIAASAVVTATFVSLNAADNSRQTARVNSLSTSFGESLKALPYLVCGSASDYQTAFANADQRKAADQRLTAVAGATLTVQSVVDNDPGDAKCPYGDSGTQLITIEVKLDKTAHVVKLVKRSPAPNSPPPTIDFLAEKLLPDGSPVMSYRLVPQVTSTVGIYLYEWWCDGSWVTATPQGTAPAPTITSEDANDPRPQCGPFVTPITPATASKTFALRVTDLAGVTWPAVAKVVVLPPTDYGLPQPTALITQTSSPECSSDDRCAAGSDVVVDGRTSKAGDGRSIVKCSWNFGDGAPPEVITGSDCVSEARARTHKYIGKGQYNLTLTVTDDLGQTDPDLRVIYVDGPVLVRPTVSIEGSVNGGAWSKQINGIAPQRVQFRSTGTHGNGGATITKYEWVYGDGGTETGASKTTAEWKYGSPTTAAACDGGGVGYKATLIVTDSNSITNSASMCVSLGSLPAPFGPNGFNFRYTNNSVGIEFNNIFDWRLYLQLNFLWGRIPVADGTPIGDLSIDVEISSSLNLTCWLGTRNANFANAQPAAGQSSKGDNIKLYGIGGLIQGATVALGNDCVYKARTKRVYEGQTYYSAWSPTQNF